MQAPVDGRISLMESHAIEIVLENGRNLRDVPYDYRSPELCLLAVQGTGWALEHVPSVLKDEEMCLIAVTHIGHALMYVPPRLRTLAVCKAAFISDEDCLAYVPDDKKWIAQHLRNETTAEGYLLTVHCDCQSWQVEVTDISGNTLVSVKTQPREMLSILLAQLRAELDDPGPCTFMLPNGQFLAKWKGDTLLEDWKGDALLVDVMPDSELSPGCPSGFSSDCVRLRGDVGASQESCARLRGDVEATQFDAGAMHGGGVGR
jgi:hypothetical protein